MKFSDLIPVEELQALCESFTAFTGAVTAVLDLKGNILVATGWQDICAKFHRMNPATAMRCRQSDTALVEEMSKREGYTVYKCKNGLVDVALPIVIGGDHIGNFFTGQFFLEEPDREYFSRQAAEFGFNETAYLQALSKAPVFSADDVKAMVDFFARLAQLIGDMALAKSNLEKANLELRESRRLLQTIIDTVPMRVFWKDRNSRYLGCNPAFALDAGKTCPAEVVGQDDYQMAWADQADLYRDDDRNVIARGTSKLSYDEPLTTPDGVTAWIRTSKVPLRNQKDEIVGMLGIYEDVTERKTAEEKIIRQSNLYAALSQCNQAIVHCTEESELCRQVCRCVVEYGFAKMAWVGLVDKETSRILPIVTYGDETRYVDGIHITASAEDPFSRGPIGTAIRDNKPVWCQDFQHDPATAPWRERARQAGLRGSASLPLCRNGMPIGCITLYSTTVNAFDEAVKKLLIEMAADISFGLDNFAREAKRKEAAEKINELAFFDQLTGLPNRTLLIDRLKQSMAASSRSNNYGALLLIDLDNFKTLNDTLGHDMGDLLLRLVGQRLAAEVCAGDTVARFGGDEFVVVLPDLDIAETDAASHVELVGEKILAALNQPYELGNVSYRCTPSIGVTLFKGLAASDDLLKQADLAMYKSKAAGRNTIRFFDPAMEFAVMERASLEVDLREALKQGQFLLYFQPQIADSNRVVGAEGLLRWQHPKRGMVSPGEFIPLAEETGLILPLGEWVLATACAQLAEWANRPEMEHLTIAVNVSARQFHQPDFVDQVQAVIHRTGANPRRLKLELTESLLVTNVEDIIEKMIALKASGVSFSLDDFGTGYSSLSYLKRLPLEQLKIDQSFVRDVLSDPNDAAIAKTVVALAESLGLGVIAEGVETAEQRNFLATLGCHAYQGYFFSRPLPLGGFEQFVRQTDPRID